MPCSSLTNWSPTSGAGLHTYSYSLLPALTVKSWENVIYSTFQNDTFYLINHKYVCSTCRHVVNGLMRCLLRIFAEEQSTRYNFGLVATKTVFGVSDKARLKPVSSATETSQNVEISPVASQDMILFNKRITMALIRLRVCAGWSALVLFANPRRQVFSRLFYTLYTSWSFFLRALKVQICHVHPRLECTSIFARLHIKPE